MKATDFITALGKYENPQRGAHAKTFFKVGGVKDEFLGATVPNTRLVCGQFKDLPLAEIQQLLDSPIHDHRLGAVILLVNQYRAARKDPQKQDDIFDLYVKNVFSGNINNWDIIDASAGYIIGPHEEDTDRRLLFKLAKSTNLWQRRVGVISAFWYVRQGDPSTTLELAEILLHDREDLIQKAVGWQLREVGKKSGHDVLMKFLDKHAVTMPRTMLRYAIEHLTPEQRKYYLSLKQRTAASVN